MEKPNCAVRGRVKVSSADKMAEAPAPAVVSEGEAPTPAAVSEEAPTSSMYFYCCESGPTNDANDNDDVWNEPGWGGRKERGTGACKMTANPTYATGVPQRLSHPPPYPLHLALTQRWRRQRWTRPGRHRRRVTVCRPIGTGARARATHARCRVSSHHGASASCSSLRAHAAERRRRAS
jgi:hypothetical protein